MYGLTAVGQKRHVPAECTDSQWLRRGKYANVNGFWTKLPASSSHPREAKIGLSGAPACSCQSPAPQGVLHPKTETVRRCHTEAERSCSGRAQPRIEGTRRRVLASGGGENPSRREGARGGRRVGRGCARTVSLAGSILPAGAGPETAAGSGTGQGSRPAEASAGRQGTGGGFFARCLAQNRGATPQERQRWRSGIYDQIREVMPVQGSMGVERMCEVARVS